MQQRGRSQCRGRNDHVLFHGAQNTDVASAAALVEGLHGRQPHHHHQGGDPAQGGSEGDNLVKTRLSTGDMADVFIYNNGSLLQAIKPEQNLTPLDDQPWAGQLDRVFRRLATVPAAKL